MTYSFHHMVFQVVTGCLAYGSTVAAKVGEEKTRRKKEKTTPNNNKQREEVRERRKKENDKEWMKDDSLQGFRGGILVRNATTRRSTDAFVCWSAHALLHGLASTDVVTCKCGSSIASGTGSINNTNN